MGIGKEVVDGIKDVAIGRPEEKKDEFEAQAAPRGFSLSKWMVWILLWVVFFFGMLFILQEEFDRLRNYIRFIEAYSGAFITLIILIGVGRAFKHSKWAKER